ncbi:MAG: DUF3450 family protein, partial [Pseudomonadota bacterium]
MVTTLPIIRLGVKIVTNLRFALLLSVIPAAQVVAQDAVSPAAVEAQDNANEAAAQSQESINGLVDQTQELSNQYAQALAELDSFNKYNEQLQVQVNGQQTEMASIQTQLVEIETTNREV